VSPHALFHRRNDRHDSRRIFLRSAFFQLNVVRVLVLRFCPVLSRSGDLSFFRFAGENQDRKSTRLNSSHVATSYAVFCLKKKMNAASRGDVEFGHSLHSPHHPLLLLAPATVDLRRRRVTAVAPPSPLGPPVAVDATCLPP